MKYRRSMLCLRLMKASLISFVRCFRRSFCFLDILINAALPIPPEEVIAAALRQMGQAQEDGRAFLVAAGKELANLLSSDFIRLKNILGRLQ